MINLKAYKTEVLKKVDSFKNMYEKGGEYFCEQCGANVGKGYAMRSYEIHNKVLCMKCHLELRKREPIKIGDYIERE